jgi:sirohydrochlorin cobaltochelatase
MNGTSSSQLGYLIVGHGTRDPVGRAEFGEVVRRIAERSSLPVAGGLLELAEPTIAQGLAELAQRGVRRVFVTPLLLFAAGHAKEDVPREVARVAAELGLVVAGMSGALEQSAPLLELSALRFGEAWAGANAAAKPALLLVGRGGSDQAALEAMRSYTAALGRKLQVHAVAAFAAKATPTVGEAIAELSGRGVRQVIVQPHLLFAGEVSQSINLQVAMAGERHPEVNLLLVHHLGPDSRLIAAIAEKMTIDNPNKKPGRT